ncbi:MAG: 50S ribosomal protein L9 [Candidatus Peribacteraceae bacterium]|nr:50S ribosomal protein L9 [Candidatus Peribacteraceae bacterium]
MEVLLLHDIPGVGKKDDLLVVGDGYALNNLLPNRAAIVATPTVRRRYAEQIRHRAEQNATEMAVARNAASQVSGKTISFAKKVTKTGKLYAAITEKAIVEELAKEHSIEIKESSVTIADPIKAIGSFEVDVDMAGSNQKLVVEVTEEK